ncbi:unnamed protein product [Caenorhabditis nigoni]
MGDSREPGNSEASTSSDTPSDDIDYDDEVPEEKQWLEYVRKNPGAKYKALTLEHFFTQAKIIAEQMETVWCTSGREDSDEEQSDHAPNLAPDPKKGPTRKLEFEEWKEKVLNDQESSGLDKIQTIPKECLAINKPNEFTNFKSLIILKASWKLEVRNCFKFSANLIVMLQLAMSYFCNLRTLKSAGPGASRFIMIPNFGLEIEFNTFWISLLGTEIMELKVGAWLSLAVKLNC